jgi:hypothetical protein
VTEPSDKSNTRHAGDNLAKSKEEFLSIASRSLAAYDSGFETVS